MQKNTLSILIVLILSYLSFLNTGCKNSVVKEEQNHKTEISHHFRPDTNVSLHKIAFGSCSNQRLDQKYWDVIAGKNPDLWIWMGDAIYSDTEDMKEHKKEYGIMKNNPHYQKFISKIPVIGTWDDHDYGVNDGDRTYPKKDESKELFLDFMDISKDAKVRKHKGVYDSYVIGKGSQKVKIYLLDNRYFKDKLEKDNQSANRYKNNNEGTVLGEEQWQWLENEIKNSDATINIFVSGLQILPDEHPYEKWANFPKERERFIKLLEKYKPKNPLIFSGDRHFAELSEYTYRDFSQNLTEVTSSGLTHSYEGVDETNSYRLGMPYDGKNFAILEIKWGGTKVAMKIKLYDITGKEVLEHGIIGEY